MQTTFNITFTITGRGSITRKLLSPSIHHAILWAADLAPEIDATDFDVQPA